MNHGPIIFLVVFLALAASWFGMVLMPQAQIGQLQQTNTVGLVPTTYPVGSPGLARQGLEVYRAQGCAYCHSQQVRQTGTVCDVELTDAGTNQPALIETLGKMKPHMSADQRRQVLTDLPKRVTRGVTKAVAEGEVKAIRAAGAKADLWIVPVGPDLERGYGKRRNLAEDFLYDSTVMPGSIRVGPDLANVGARLPDRNWHLRHLYAPAVEIKGSVMPPYRYLFEKRRITHDISPKAVAFPAEANIPSGYEIVPSADADALVAYLMSLRVDAPLYEAPFTVPPPPPQATNAAGQVTNAPAPAASSTNAAAPSSSPPGAVTTNAPAK